VTGDRVSVLSNAVPAREAQRTDRRYDVAIVARLHPRKGVTLACDVIRAVLDRSPTVRVAVAGADEGELQAVHDLVSAFPGSVEYLGGLTSREARECIAAAKILLAVATDEPFGLTVVEAFREGTAVVLGSGGYTLEGSWSSDGAVSLADREVAALADEVEYLLEHPARLAAVVEAGRRWAVQHASVEAMSERISRDLTGSTARGSAMDQAPFPMNGSAT